MSEPDSWGGTWTDEKLLILQRYLTAYVTALKDQPFSLGYIDAFAGAGYRVNRPPSDSSGQVSLLGDAPVEAYRKGSARVALDLEPGFDGYVFIEKDRDKAAELDALALARPERSIRVHRGDANEQLQQLCLADWRRRRAVVFLDPFGMQVEWATLEALAATRAVDVWTLFPVGVAVNRLLTQRLEDIPAGWQRRLDTTFGTTEWRARLYEPADVRAARMGGPSLFGEQVPSRDESVKIPGLDRIAGFYLERLGTIFPHVADRCRFLSHPSGQPLYALAFAAANPNPKAGKASLRIAGHLLGRWDSPRASDDRLSTR